MSAQDDAPAVPAKAVRYAFAVTALVCVAVLLWALYWPSADCDRPSCARQRYSVALEIDALGQLEPISLEIEDADRSISLTEILRGGGVELRASIDQVGLPYDPASGPLDRADLFQFVSAWRNQAPTDVDATLYALFVNSLIGDNGEELFGIMFDTSGREGFAVAPRTTERFFREYEPGLIATLQLRTFAHELLHALNRHHADATLTQDGRLTLEAPTRCISERQPRGWRLREPPSLEISPRTIHFFQTATAREVLPGPANSPFTYRRATPTECEDARERDASAHVQSRWDLALRRLQLLFSFNSAEAAEAQSEPEPESESKSDSELESEPEQPSANIRLQAQAAPYPLGYPVAVRVMVENTGEQPLPIVDRLNPSYGMLVIEHRQLGSDDWQPLQPITWFETTDDENVQLQPGARTEETVPIYYGEDGWTFEAAGEYEIRARLQLGASTQDILSEAIAIAVTDPGTDEDRQALQPLLNAEGELARDVGRLLYFGGRIGDRDDLEPLELTADKLGHTAVGGAMRLTLLSQRLRRPIDPTTGIRPAPNFDDARELLEDTCTDSGVAAMTLDVLEQGGDSLPASFRTRTETEAAAWDGVTPSRTSLPTYSDPMLERAGPSLHFCFNQAELRGPVRGAITRLARELRRARPTRIVLVGHSDSVGTCRYNDTLALARARAVRRALLASGLKRTPIEVVGIGERRPLSFASASEAQQLNRRVEVLVEGTADADTDARIIPRCPLDSIPPAGG